MNSKNTKVAVFLGNTLLDFIEIPSAYKGLTEDEILSTIQKFFGYPIGIELEEV